MTKRPPRVGFVSLGCPKALVDSERIVTELRAEGYLISSTYKDSDLVIVNTCGFIDAAVQESLEAISEALNENGKVIVTGCLGGKNTDEGNFVALRFPNFSVSQALSKPKRSSVWCMKIFPGRMSLSVI